VKNATDTCPLFANANQATMPSAANEAAWCNQDTDGDGVRDSNDNCPYIANPDQSDLNHNGIGDVCDVDQDGDGIADKVLKLDANKNAVGSTPILSSTAATTARRLPTTTSSTRRTPVWAMRARPTGATSSTALSPRSVSTPSRPSRSTLVWRPRWGLARP